jgi:hypothetical protein
MTGPSLCCSGAEGLGPEEGFSRARRRDLSALSSGGLLLLALLRAISISADSNGIAEGMSCFFHYNHLPRSSARKEGARQIPSEQPFDRTHDPESVCIITDH